jgi:hypothetical protein
MGFFTGENMSELMLKIFLFYILYIVIAISSSICFIYSGNWTGRFYITEDEQKIITEIFH